MERFAMKIDNNVKSNVFKICRLCGIDNPHKVAILEEVVSLLDGEDELPLYKKIFNCIGIQVSADDKMPKTICALCFDKINDFHEFREMCYSTNSQTRKLLGLLPQVYVEKKWNPNTIFNPIASEQLESLQRRNRKRRFDDIPLPPDIKFDNKMIKLENQPNIFLSNNIMNKNQFNIIKTEKDIILEKKIGKRNILLPSMVCNICQVNFCSTALLQSHLLKAHVPIIARYHCVQCNETIGNSLEIKNHNLWHRLSKTPFQCGRCDKRVISLQGLTRHMRECSKKIIRPVTIIPNIECKLCSVEFATKNLYYMHSCVTSKLRCPKCNCKMTNPITTLKHIATCSIIIKDDVEDNFIIKNEPIDLPTSLAPPSLAPLSSSIVDIKPSSLISNNPSMVVIPPLSSMANSQSSSNQLLKDNTKKNKKMKKDSEDTLRRCGEILKNMKTLVNIKDEPVEDGITNIQSTSSESSKQLALNINSGNPAGQDLPAVRVKQEIIDESYRDTTNIEINIKQEIIEKVQPALKLKIKKEHGTLNASFIQNENYKTGGNVLEDPSNIVELFRDSNKSKSTNDEQLVGDGIRNVIETGKELTNKEILESTKKTAKTLPIPIIIKQEVIDKENSDLEDELLATNDDFHHGNYDSDDDNNVFNHQDSNVPTSTEKKTTDKNEENSKIENVINKPEISPMLIISSISSAGNVVKTTTNEATTDPSENNSADMDNNVLSKKSVMPQILSVSGGVNFPANSEKQNTENSFGLPQISSISSGVEVPSNRIDFENTRTNDDNTNFNYVKIKKEKIDPGYNDLDEYQQEDDQQSLQIPNMNNQYDMNFIGAVRIKQEIEFAEEGFGDEVQSEYSDDENNSDCGNEFSNHINDSHKEIEEIQNNDKLMTTITDYENMKTINTNNSDCGTNYENIENNSNNNGQTQNRTDLECNFPIDTNTDIKFKENSMNEHVNNDSINNTNKMPIISQVNSINISDIYKIQDINSSYNIEKSEIPYSPNHKEELNQNNIANLDNTDSNLMENISLNHQNIVPNILLNSINNPISGTSASPSQSLLTNSLLEPTLTVPEYKNINEIAENHNNENLEKLLRYETTEQIPPIRPLENEDVIPNLEENLERQQEINENTLNTNNESINTINNSNISLDLDNITKNILHPTD